MQPQGHVQVVVALAEDQLDPQTALDRPRFCIRPGTVAVGRHAGQPGRASRKAFRRQSWPHWPHMGHPVTVMSGHERAFFGRGQIILRDAATGVLCGGSDPRADGCAMALS